MVKQDVVKGKINGCDMSLIPVRAVLVLGLGSLHAALACETRSEMRRDDKEIFLQPSPRVPSVPLPFITRAPVRCSLDVALEGKWTDPCSLSA